MKYAIVSDIHGNTIALDAILNHIERNGGVDGYWFVGDYCANGYNPTGVLERISQLANAVFVRGNTDRYVVRGELPHPQIEDAQNNPQLVPNLVEIVSSFSWTRGVITYTGWFDWLARLQLEYRLTLPDGTRVLLVHAAPGTDDGSGIRLDHTDDDLRVILKGCDADLIFVGHTHILLDKIVDGTRIVNLGSISNPNTPDLRASYVTIETTNSGYSLEFQRVEYDYNAVIDNIYAVKHPTPDYLVGFMQGKHLSELFKK